MKAHQVVIVALAFSHLVVASKGPAPLFAGRAMGDTIDILTRRIASPHIIGGDEAEPHSYPHQVAIFAQLGNRQEYLCGGTLISPEWVMTAAHCAGLSSVFPMQVHLGRHDLIIKEAMGQAAGVVKIITHAQHNRTTKVNDIALLKLDLPATLNKYVQPIRLPSLASKSQDIKSGTPVVLIGWGSISIWSLKFPPTLRFLKTELLSNDVCASLVRNVPISKTMACADVKQGKGVWRGDSGGPMLMTDSDGKPTVIGIASFVKLEGSAQSSAQLTANIYTRVDPYLEWIAKHTGIKPRQE